LTTAQVEHYGRDGYLFPISVLAPAELHEARTKYADFESSLQQELRPLPASKRGPFFRQTHVTQRWVFDLATHPRLLDAVESVLGPDLLIWSTQWFPKAPHDQAFISWHQDGTYWGLHPPDVCTAWLGLTPSTDANGCMRVDPGSHHRGQMPHRETYADDNALSRGQEIAVDVPEDRAVSLVLDAGEMSLHHIGVAHSSRPNKSDESRIGLAVRFITPNVEQDADGSTLYTTAMLVRGVDRRGHFELLDAPPAD
jgi:ectoine hydroxylase-related dioxygenase (phytanoyl-CoA dioxygenase family)